MAEIERLYKLWIAGSGKKGPDPAGSGLETLKVHLLTEYITEYS